MKVPVVLTIAGSDSGGGAGIQADLRTFAFHCVHGSSAITCVTAQNTTGVAGVTSLAPEVVSAQIEAVATDLGVQGVKTGMLLNREIMRAVVRQIEKFSFPNLVVDPVMVSRTGAKLIAEEGISYLRDELLPFCAIATPNRYEAQILSGIEINSLDEMRIAAQRIQQLGAKAVLVKGGGMGGYLKGVDVWFDGQNWETLQATPVKTKNDHGTGCTLSSAIVANLALGQDPLSAVRNAKKYVTTALQYALDIGKGHGPVGHFFPLLPQE